MKLPESLQLIGEYLEEKRGGANHINECDCIVSGIEKNILILSLTDCTSFTDKGFSKNDAIDVKIYNKSYPGAIKELYSKYCYVEILAKNINIKPNKRHKRKYSAKRHLIITKSYLEELKK